MSSALSSILRVCWWGHYTSLVGGFNRFVIFRLYFWWWPPTTQSIEMTWGKSTVGLLINSDQKSNFPTHPMMVFRVVQWYGSHVDSEIWLQDLELHPGSYDARGGNRSKRKISGRLWKTPPQQLLIFTGPIVPSGPIKGWWCLVVNTH